MNTGHVFIAAFWAGFAAPAALYAPIPPYRPLVANLTIGDSFFSVGLLLNKLASEQNGFGQSASASPAAEQLSFEFREG